MKYGQKITINFNQSIIKLIQTIFQKWRPQLQFKNVKSNNN